MYYFCLGPLEETIEDFWRMIWEMKTFTIVMLTDLEERGRVRLNDYICLLLSFLFFYFFTTAKNVMRLLVGLHSKVNGIKKC